MFTDLKLETDNALTKLSQNELQKNKTNKARWLKLDIDKFQEIYYFDRELNIAQINIKNNEPEKKYL